MAYVLRADLEERLRAAVPPLTCEWTASVHNRAFDPPEFRVCVWLGGDSLCVSQSIMGEQWIGFAIEDLVRYLQKRLYDE